MTSTPLTHLRNGDVVSVTFSPPFRPEEDDLPLVAQAQGDVQWFGGWLYLMARDVRAHTHGVCYPIRLCERTTPAYEDSFYRVRTKLEEDEDKGKRALGRLVCERSPTTPEEVEEQLDMIADEIVLARKQKDASGPGSLAARAATRRERELRLQMQAIAALVELSKRKQRYIVERARIGSDFNPWTTDDTKVIRIETHRPLPADFEIDPACRKDRSSRLEQAVHLYGESEREVRLVKSRLRRAGYDVRRVHPDAQLLSVRFHPLSRGKVDVIVGTSPNGHWGIVRTSVSNKQDSRCASRISRDGTLRKLARAIEDGDPPTGQYDLGFNHDRDEAGALLWPTTMHIHPDPS